MIRRPPRSTLFPSPRSSDLSEANSWPSEPSSVTVSPGPHQSSSMRTRFWTPPLFIVNVDGVLPVRIAALMVRPLLVPLLGVILKVPGQLFTTGALGTATRFPMGRPDSAGVHAWDNAVIASAMIADGLFWTLLATVIWVVLKSPWTKTPLFEATENPKGLPLGSLKAGVGVAGARRMPFRWGESPSWVLFELS